MIRTCRLLFPVRSNYNASLLNQRLCQSKQISMEFSFNAEQWKDHQKKFNEHVKVEFSTFKQNEKIEPYKSEHKKSKDTAISDYSIKARRDTLNKNILSEPSNKVDIDLSTRRKNLLAKSVNDDLHTEFAEKYKFKKNVHQLVSETSAMSIVSENAFHLPSYKTSSKFDQISHSAAIKSLKVLAKTGNREITNIKFYCNALMINEMALTLADVSNVLFALAKLNFADMPLLNLLAEQVLIMLKKEEELNSKVLISLLHSVCKLKFKNVELISGLCESLNKVQNLVPPEQTALCLFAVSNINLRTTHVENFINILSKLENTDFNKTRNFLNYIWASVILEKQSFLPLKHVEAVLSKKFMEQLTTSGENTLLNKIKLANISGTAASLKDYKGPLVDQVVLSPVLSKSKNNFLSVLRDSLSYIFPKSGFIEALSYAGSGVFTDIECCVDSSCNPVLLKNKKENHKIGIVLLDHSDYCIGDSNEVTGVNAFKISTLKQNGYKVITISHKEFPFSSPLSEKIGYLRNKFKKVINAKQ